VTALGAALGLLVGLACTGLGALTAYELLRDRRRRGWSPFGGAFVLMAATCGPQHLAHAAQALLGGEPLRGPLIAALALGVAPGVAFVALRVEALLGGRGDRPVPGTPTLLAVVPWLACVVAGATLWEAVAEARHHGAALVHVGPNVVLLVTYTVVGVLILRTQMLRRAWRDDWSLSGLAFGAVFPCWGLAHVVEALTMAPGWQMLVLDYAGVPASLGFLWVVRGLHHSALRDWNRRPLVGRAGALSRRSPWAEAAPAH
jgi:hypothetical protein